MGRWFAVALVLLGCAETAIVQPAEVDAAVPVDAGEEPGAEPPHRDCPGADASTTCVPVAAADGGYRYGCYTGVCPVGDAGSCTIVATQPKGYVETVCERAACTRLAFSDVQQCGGEKGWQCPWSNGKLLAQPPGNCRAWLDPLPDSTGVIYCCK